jgi:hypothetical protein
MISLTRSNKLDEVFDSFNDYTMSKGDNLRINLDEDFDSLNDYAMSKGDNLRISSLDEDFDSLDDNTISKVDNLRISSQDETYSFFVDKYLIMKAFPDSMLSTMMKSKGKWIDQLDVILPFDKESVVSLEKFFKNMMWSDDKNKEFGEEYATAVNVLRYLSIPFSIDSNMSNKYGLLPIDYDNNRVIQTKNQMLVIVSEIDGYWFDIEKDIIQKAYPESVLSTLMNGPWLDRDEVILPFSGKLLKSLEAYLHVGSWVIYDKLRSGQDLYNAHELLDYLMIPFNEKIEYYEDLKNPYVETDDDYITAQDLAAKYEQEEEELRQYACHYEYDDLINTDYYGGYEDCGYY